MRTAFFSGVAVVALVAFFPASSARAEILKPPPKPVAQVKALGAVTDKDPADKVVKSASPRSVGKPGDVEPKITFPKFYAQDYVGETQSYVAKYEDTMVQIARDHNMGFVELRAANPFLDPWIPGEGKKVMIPAMHILPRAPREGVVINLAEMRMYTYLKPGQPPKTFPLGIGHEGLLTPSGTTTIVRKKDGPTWRPTARMRKENPALPAVVPPGPDNPMGTHALYLGWPEYAIHGTDKPYSIGRRASSGCIRMYPEDIAQAFGALPVGTQVTVVNQSVKTGWIGNKLFLEAHPTMEQADKMEVDGGLPGYVFPEEDMGVIVASAGEYVRDLNWPLIRQVIRERRGYPVEIFHRPEGSAPAPAPVAEAVVEKDKDAAKVEAVAVNAEDAVAEKTAAPVTTPN